MFLERSLDETDYPIIYEDDEAFGEDLALNAFIGFLSLIHI